MLKNFDAEERRGSVSPEGINTNALPPCHERIVLQRALPVDFGAFDGWQCCAGSFALKASADSNRAELFDISCATAIHILISNVDLACW